jgi:flagellar basal body-associated protein FliL
LEFVDLSEVEEKDSLFSISSEARDSTSRSPSLWTFLIITITLALILGMLVYLFLSLQ